MAYGRLHEATFIRKYYTRKGITKLFGYIPLRIKMLQTKRLAPFPKKIKRHETLSRIIKKAQEIGMRHVPEPLKYSPEYVDYKAVGEMKLEQRKGN